MFREDSFYSFDHLEFGECDGACTTQILNAETHSERVKQIQSRGHDHAIVITKVRAKVYFCHAKVSQDVNYRKKVRGEIL